MPANSETIYLIKHDESGLYKIGMTANWSRRSRELKVGVSTRQVKIISCQNARKWEKVLHSMFKHKRLPQSEWFKISEADAISKMNWLASQTYQRMVVGNWQQAEAGHWYRRRKSSNGYWYTETKSSAQMKAQLEQQLNSTISYAETSALRKARGAWVLASKRQSRCPPSMARE